MSTPQSWDALLYVVGILVVALAFVPFIVSVFLKNVEAGTVRMVSWYRGGTLIYRGPGKAIEVPLLSVGTTLSSKAINVDLDITDQTADVDEHGQPKPIKVRVLASAIVSVGDSDSLIKTAANRFFSKPYPEQLNTLSDLLSSAGRRAVNLLTHDQLFSAKTVRPAPQQPCTPAASQELQRTTRPAFDPLAVPVADNDDDPLAIIIRKACSRELTDLGLIFNSLNIKVVQSEVAEARRRQSAAEAQANADIVSSQQARRAKEAQLEAERVICDKERELEQTRAANAVLIAQAEAKKQEAIEGLREAELAATQLTQARADAEKLGIEASARAHAEATRITTVAEANAQSIRQVNEAIAEGGESYFRYRQIELLPHIAPHIAGALAQSKMITIAGNNNGAPDSTTNSIAGVIQTVLAAQLVPRNGLFDVQSGGSTPDIMKPSIALPPQPAVNGARG